MKKIYQIITVLFLSIILVSCTNNSNNLDKLNELKNTLEISFNDNDDINNVTSNIILPTNFDGYDIEITWLSNNGAITIDGESGIVNRLDATIIVRISAHLKSGDDEVFKHFNVTVLAKDEVGNPSNKPVISGTKDFNLFEGDSKPDYLAGVTAKDSNNNTLVVLVNHSNVDLTKKGSYDLIYTVKDSNNNETSITVKVNVIEKVLEDTLLYHFLFNKDLSHGYSDPNETSTLINSVDNTSITINKKRANTLETGNGLVLSGASKTDTGAFIELNFSENISKITFEMKSWGEFDLPQTTEAKFQVKNGTNWVDVKNLLPDLGLDIKQIEITELNAKNYRFYVNGNTSTQNTARIIFTDMKIYGGASTISNPNPNPDPTPINEVISIKNALLETHNKLVTIEGVVTGFVGNQTYAIKDASGSIALFSPNALEIGRTYVIKGIRSEFNGLEQLGTKDSPLQIVETKGVAVNTPQELSINLLSLELKPYVSHFVKLNNLTVVSRNTDTYGTIFIMLKDASNNQMELRADNRYPNFTEVANKLNQLVVGNSYNFSLHIGWYKTDANLVFGPGSSANNS
ncbi:immunoglobulin-like domain-containing protein [Acholeplasma granularum]|uniref:immunoglobulin-like domain-containing protein n=1 Tax=Acholeplasma granularum TaxID=264635 RepID=UPI000472F3CE|nr:immunoglobulin-like domain-containing protein [Acholeplasma granularum]